MLIIQSLYRRSRMPLHSDHRSKGALLPRSRQLYASISLERSKCFHFDNVGQFHPAIYASTRCPVWCALCCVLSEPSFPFRLALYELHDWTEYVTESEVFMAQQERKEREHRTAATENKAMQPSRSRSELAWRDPFASFWNDPLSLFQRDWLPSQREVSPWRTGQRTGTTLWSPQIETFHRGDQFVVRADLPGLKKEDVNIELTDDSLTIEGERREEHEEDREGYYRSERSYGSFYRVVPLPEGAIAESAKAKFENGVLEVEIQAPPREVSRKRRIEIT